MASNPTQEKIDGLLSLPADRPIVLMNLLRFSEGGDKTFQEYVRHCQKHGPRFGVEFVYLGKSSYVVVAEEGQAWDAVWLVRYPNPKAFFEILHDADFKAGFHLRGDSLVEMVLQATTPWEL